MLGRRSVRWLGQLSSSPLCTTDDPDRSLNAYSTIEKTIEQVACRPIACSGHDVLLVRDAL